MEIDADILKIVSAAITTPSGDNAQPFYFIYKKNRILEIHHNAKAAHHQLNHAGTGSLITLGFCLELISIEASSQGLVPLFSFTPSLGSQNTSHWVTIEFKSAPVHHSILQPAITQRCVDRRHFQGGDLNSAVFHEIKQDLAEFNQMTFSTLTPNTDLLKYLCVCETLTFAHPSIISDILSWVRFSKKEKFATRDGLYWNNLGVNWVQSRLLLLLKKLPQLTPLLLKAGLKKEIESVFTKQLASSAGILLFSTQDTSQLGLIAGGRACMRAWLHLTLHGYGVQPMTISTLCLLDWKLNRLSSVINQHYRDNFAYGLIQWQKSAELPQQALPFWAFRVGLSPSLPDDCRTLRKNLNQVLKLG